MRAARPVTPTGFAAGANTASFEMVARTEKSLVAKRPSHTSLGRRRGSLKQLIGLGNRRDGGPSHTRRDPRRLDRERRVDGPPTAPYASKQRRCSGCSGALVARRSPTTTEEAGFWSVTTADDVHAVSRDWQTYSSELGGITALTDAVMPLELIQAMFIGMDPPKHDRAQGAFQRGFTPKRIAEHEDEIRAITVGVLDRLEGRERCDLVTDVAQPVVSRVIGSFMGIPPEDDEVWARLMNTMLGAGDPDVNPEGVESVMQRTCRRSSSAAAS